MASESPSPTQSTSSPPTPANSETPELPDHLLCSLPLELKCLIAQLAAQQDEAFEEESKNGEATEREKNMRMAAMNQHSGKSLSCLSMVNSTWRQICAPYLFDTFVARSNDDLAIRLSILSKYSSHFRTFVLAPPSPSSALRAILREHLREHLTLAAMLPNLTTAKFSVRFLQTVLPLFFHDSSTTDLLFQPFSLVARKLTTVTLVDGPGHDAFSALSFFPHVIHLHINRRIPPLPLPDPDLDLVGPQLSNLRHLNLDVETVAGGSRLLQYVYTILPAFI